jgi:hypothetical protein
MAGTESHAIVLTEWCPTCGATRGVKCQTMSGRPIAVGSSHAERWRLVRPPAWIEGGIR